MFYPKIESVRIRSFSRGRKSGNEPKLTYLVHGNPELDLLCILVPRAKIPPSRSYLQSQLLPLRNGERHILHVELERHVRAHVCWRLDIPRRFPVL